MQIRYLFLHICVINIVFRRNGVVRGIGGIVRNGDFTKQGAERQRLVGAGQSVEAVLVCKSPDTKDDPHQQCRNRNADKRADKVGEDVDD